MKIGELLRQRNVRTYGTGDCRNWFEFSADKERKKSLKRVFVTLLLGTEMMDLTEAEPLDPARQLNGLGWWGEDQLIAALGKKKAEALVHKMANKPSEKSAKARKNHKTKGSS